MYICENCDITFETPLAIEESRGEHFGFPSWETVYVCPMCNGDFTEKENEDDFYEC